MSTIFFKKNATAKPTLNILAASKIPKVPLEDRPRSLINVHTKASYKQLCQKVFYTETNSSIMLHTALKPFDMKFIYYIAYCNLWFRKKVILAKFCTKPYIWLMPLLGQMISLLQFLL